ncbi:MAG: VWA domain-containing protein [Candidatus Aminicenantes bacterium]|nr:VWA domain-containing protein [Candidatus Aminicenantes bacterium]
MRRTRPFFPIVAVAFFLFFRQPGLFFGRSTPTSPQGQEIPQLTHQVDVVINNIDVVVTDKQGRRVTGLRPENFKIFEDGLPQKVSNFYEVQGLEVKAYAPDLEHGLLSAPKKIEAAPALGPPKSIVFYFDNRQLNPLNRNSSIKTIEPFIRKTISAEKNIQGMVVCLDHNLEIIQGLTSDPEALLRAIDRVKERTGQSLLEMRNREEMIQELNRMATESQKANRLRDSETAMGFARSYVENRHNDIIFSLKALNAFLNFLAGVAGKKILIYVSDSMSINPAEDVFGYLDQAFPLGNARMESLNYDVTAQFKEFTARCNAWEVTLYPINTQGLETTVLSADKASGWNTYARGSGMVKSGSRTTAEALKIMAFDTGGQAILDSREIEAGLVKVAEDLEYYYSLGYKSPNREDNQYHDIRVELDDAAADYRVRVRQGYVRVSHEEKIKEAVFSRLFYPGQQNPTGIAVQALPLKNLPGTDRLQLTLKLLIPIHKLMLTPQGDVYSGQIRVYMALKDREGEISPCYVLTHEIKIPAGDYALAQKRSYPYLTEMTVAKTRYTISLAVEDIPGETISYIQLEKEIL